MKLALIPPKGLERFALRSKLQLTLAQIHRGPYQDVYKEARDRGDFIILDNGANEGVPVGDGLLMQMAQMYRATEVVVPDVLRDRGKTLQRARRFFQNMIEMGYPTKPYRFMGVAQGQTLEEVQSCIEAYSHIRHIRTIGIPRHLITTLDEETARIRLAKFVFRHFEKRFKIHFLGTNPQWLEEIAYAAHQVPFVRSVDTSAAFVYAIDGKKIEAGCPAITRQIGYFENGWNINPSILEDNIQTLRRWASGVR